MVVDSPYWLVGRCWELCRNVEHQTFYPAAIINVVETEELSMCHLMTTPDLEGLPLSQHTQLLSQHRSTSTSTAQRAHRYPSTSRKVDVDTPDM